MVNGILIAFIMIGVLLSAGGQVFLKLGMSAARVQTALAAQDGTGIALALIGSPWVIGGLVVYGLSVFVWLLVLSKVDVSYAYPFVALGMVVTTLSGRFLLAESLPPLRVVGLAVIVVGVALVAWSYPRTA